MDYTEWIDGRVEDLMNEGVEECEAYCRALEEVRESEVHYVA